MKNKFVIYIALSIFLISGCEKASDLAKVGVSNLSAAAPVPKMTASRWAEEVVDGIQFGTDLEVPKVDNEIVNKGAAEALLMWMPIMAGVSYKRTTDPRVAQNWDRLVDKLKTSAAAGILAATGKLTGCEGKLEARVDGKISPFARMSFELTEIGKSTDPHKIRFYQLVDELMVLCLSVSPGFENVLSRGYKMSSNSASSQRIPESSLPANSSTPQTNPRSAEQAIVAEVKQEPSSASAPEQKVELPPKQHIDAQSALTTPQVDVHPPRITQDSNLPTPQNPEQNQFAPSFDCTKASSGQERLICSDRELSKLDVELNIAYVKAREIVTDRAKVRESQLQWLKYSRNACSDKNCLKQTYKQRIEELAGIASAG